MLPRLWLLVGSDRPTDRQCHLLSCPGQLKKQKQLLSLIQLYIHLRRQDRIEMEQEKKCHHMFTFVLYVCWCRIMLVFQFLFWKYLREVFVCVFVPAFCVCVFVLNYAKVISFFFFRKAFEGSRRPYCGPLMVPLSAVLTRLLLLLTLTVHEKTTCRRLYHDDITLSWDI